mmetsp:Transcript_16600/g.55348  ORF Transcript_16600/g.55348 Transcript_16600/m.55348 type:complete len:367 (-) Transcript_16600:33-1133(-)
MEGNRMRRVTRASLTCLGVLLMWFGGRVDGRLQLPEEADRGMQVMEYAKHGVAFFHKVFTPEECESIIELFKERCKVDEDHRNDKGVRRINRIDAENKLMKESKLDWIYERVINASKTSKLMLPWGFNVTETTSEQFRNHVEFNLLHEFKAGYFFDFHIDTKPNDGTSRTININIMLSARDKYKGGELQVGAINVVAEQGDMYFYPAAFPHKVHDITEGLRHTFIIASCATNDKSEAVRKSADYLNERVRYFQLAARNHAILDQYAESGVDRPEVNAKILWLHGEFLDASGHQDLADDLFARSYAASGQGPDYAEHFFAQGIAAIQAGQVETGKKTIEMALKVHPQHARARETLLVLESAMHGDRK